MSLTSQRWPRLFLFCLGIFLASAFIMQWLASDFWWGGKRFSILDIELFYSRETLADLFREITPLAKAALNYQLIFDFVFMAGAYPGIASLCMMTREKINRNGLRSLLFGLACLQPVAWGFDITEDIFILRWMNNPVIGDEFGMYHNIVIAKWLIAIIGALAALTLWLFRNMVNRK